MVEVQLNWWGGLQERHVNRMLSATRLGVPRERGSNHTPGRMATKSETQAYLGDPFE